METTPEPGKEARSRRRLTRTRSAVARRPGSPTAIDLFCGAGGFSAGFSQAGFGVAAAIEKERVFCETHRVNFPEARLVHAAIEVTPPKAFAEAVGLRPGDVEVVCGGPPCQTFSTIGVAKIRSVKGHEDEVASDPRNYLFASYFDYVDYFRPAVFVMENVPTMKTRYGGKLFRRILELIDGMGYEPHVEILNAADYGVPQVRKRLVVVGTAKGVRFSFPRATHSVLGDKGQQQLSLGTDRGLPPTPTVYDAIAELPEIEDGCRDDELPYASSVNLTDYQRQMRNTSGTVRNNICRVSNDRAKKVFPHMAQGSKYMDLPAHVRKILPFREDIFFDRLKRLDMSKPSWTVLAHIGMDGYMYIHPTQNRTLSVREAARIQSFHDSFVFVGNMREQYVQVGNAVPPLLAKQVGLSVRRSLE